MAFTHTPTRYPHDGRMLTVNELAALAGCSGDVMRSRLRNATPERAVAMGAATLYRKHSRPMPPGTGKKPATYLLNGEPKTAAELGKLCGRTASTMRKRLKRMTVEDAVSTAPMPARTRAPTSTTWATKFHDLNGESVTAKQLAERCGCKIETMRFRLKTHTAAEALAMKRPAVKVKRERIKYGRTREAKCPAPRVDDFQRKVKPGSKLEKVIEWRGQVLLAGEEFIPDDVKRTIAPTPPDRFAVQPGGTFGRIGQYECTGSALERAALERVDRL